MDIIEYFENTLVPSLVYQDFAFSFLHADKDWQNMEADEMEFPCILIDMPLSYTPIITKSGHIEREYNLAVLILFDSQLDNQPIDEQTIFNHASNVADQLFNRIDNDKENIKIATFTKVTQIQFEFDRVVSGVFFPLNIILSNFNGVCLP